MRQRLEYRIGPGMTSLLMIFMVLCLATLAILAYASTRMDSTLTQRNVESSIAYYEASAEAQQVLYDLDAKLQELRTQAGGDTARYAEGVRQAFDLEAGEADSMEDIPLEVIERMDDQRILRLQLHIPVALTGDRYTLHGYQAVNDSAWDAEQGIGYYVPAASDDDEDDGVAP